VWYNALNNDLVEIIKKIHQVLDVEGPSPSIDAIKSNELSETIEKLRNTCRIITHDRFATDSRILSESFTWIEQMCLNLVGYVSNHAPLILHLKQYVSLLNEGENQTVNDLVEFLSLFN
jgi:hypothetical protein